MSDGVKWAGRVAVSAVLALALAAAGARADDAVSIDRALIKQAPGVLQYLRDHHYKNVAVLKFLAAYDKGKPRDDLGVLNRTLADRLEVALVLGLTDDDERRLSILTHASDVVDDSGNRKLNHRTEDGSGRAAFFSDHPLTFPRAWVLPGQSEKAPADAFLTGEAVVAADWKSVRVRIQVFDRDDPKTLRTIGDEFTAAVDPRTLTELNVSFAPGKKGVPEEDDTPTQQVSKLEILPPTVPGTPPPPQKAWDDFLANSPVKLDVLYNGASVPVREGAVETPTSNDKVKFRLRNTDPKTTYGVVLKINGESTIEKQKLAPLDCYKWVLAPGADITVEGFQADGEMANGFTVLPPAASQGQEVNYGDNAGVFSLVVFREATDKEKEKDGFVDNDDKKNEEVKAVSRGSLSAPGDHPPQSLKALQDELTPTVLSGAAKKGLIVPAGPIASKTRHVDFVPFPRPEYSLVVRYYQPQN